MAKQPNQRPQSQQPKSQRPQPQDNKRRPPQTETEAELMARLISYSGGGTQQMTDAQHREISEQMTQLQLGMASQELDQREVMRQWETYQRRFRRGRRAGCLGRIIMLPGCLAVSIVWMLLSGGFVAILLAALSAVVLSRGGDLSYITRLPELLNLLNPQTTTSPDGLIPVPGAPNSTVLLGGGGALLALGVLATVLVRSTLRSVFGLLALVVMIGLAIGGVFLLSQNGTLDQFINQIPGITG